MSRWSRVLNFRRSVGSSVSLLWPRLRWSNSWPMPRLSGTVTSWLCDRSTNFNVANSPEKWQAIICKFEIFLWSSVYGIAMPSYTCMCLAWNFTKVKAWYTSWIEICEYKHSKIIFWMLTCLSLSIEKTTANYKGVHITSTTVVDNVFLESEALSDNDCQSGYYISMKAV